jgi:hypothetical protein
MSYRLVTFDANGKISAISPKSFTDTDTPVLTFVAVNPNKYAFIEEDLLPTGKDLARLEKGTDSTVEYSFDGLMVRSDFLEAQSFWDPRTETIVTIDDPSPYIQFGVPVTQDLTKVGVFYNTLDTSTIPFHSSSVKKFGPSSGRFTRSIAGYTGGGLYVTNICKRTATGLTAPHNTLGAGSTATYSFELFFYPTTTALANNFTLLQKGPTGASANWKLGFDSGAGFLQFAWQSYGYTGGYNYSQNIINTAGITANTWHHVAVAVVKNAGTCGSYQISGYWNRANVFSTGVTLATFPEYRYNQGIYIGNNHLGSESFDGYMDSIRVLEAPSTGGIFGPTGYGFLPFGGGTLGVPTLQGFTLNSTVSFLINFNGLDNVSSFYAESTDKHTGVACRLLELAYGVSGPLSDPTDTYTELGIRDIYRYQYGLSGATGLIDGDIGFSSGYGPLVVPYVNFVPIGLTGFTAHGYDYIFAVYDAKDAGLGVTGFKSIYKNNTLYEYCLERMAFIEGACGNRGSSGNVFQSRLGINPFGRLFSGMGGNCYGISANHTNLFIDPLNAETMNYIMTNGYLVTQGICYSSYTFKDALNFQRTLTGTEINNLRLDILDYYNKLSLTRRDTKDTIKTATTKSSVKTTKNNKASGNPEISGEEPLPGP